MQELSCLVYNQAVTNQKIAEVFRKIAACLELEGKNPFRIRAYRRAAHILDRLTEPAGDIARRGDLRKISGIGKDLEQKILDLLTTGAIREDRPPGRQSQKTGAEALEIPGIDPKISRLLRTRFRMETWEDLERLARSRLLRTVPDLGPEIEQTILRVIAERASAQQNSGELGKSPSTPDILDKA